MSQTKAGAKKAVAKIKLLHGADFFKRLGATGGSAPHARPRGFAAHPELASAAGRKGGAAPRKDR